uniref:Uncharacterized protein n=1 Tax=Anopheles culicifacies TaxID=139723 RepID=A0A182M3M9_9DIPT
MNLRLCIVLFVSMAVVTVKGLPGLGDSLWSKLSATSLKSAPLFADDQIARSFPKTAPFPNPKEEPRKSKPLVETKLAVPLVSEDQPMLKLLPEAFSSKPQKKEPEVLVKTRSNPDAESDESVVPIFAKLLLGDPNRPQLASTENLRKINWRSVETELELPNKHTMPMVKELLLKTEELLRVFLEIQQESNGFVDDVRRHNRNARKEYIGYFN